MADPVDDERGQAGLPPSDPISSGNDAGASVGEAAGAAAGEAAAGLTAKAAEEGGQTAAEQIGKQAGGAAGAAAGAVAGKEAAIEAGQTLDLADAPSVSPKIGVQTSGELMTGLQRAGVDLAKWMLSIIGISLAALVLLVACNESKRSSELAAVVEVVKTLQSKMISAPANDPGLPEARKDIQELVRQVADATQAQRAFWMQFSQMILLNLLLPVLTAILGYVFGANSSRQ